MKGAVSSIVLVIIVAVVIVGLFIATNTPVENITLPQRTVTGRAVDLEGASGYCISKEYCGGKAPVPYNCYCDELSVTPQYNDYCQDIDIICGITKPIPSTGSCQGKCGQFIEGASCQCDIASLDPKYNDHCQDIQTVCPEVYAKAKETTQQIGPKPPAGSCLGYCDSKDPIPGISPPKYCDDLCESYGDCGYDYQNVCKGITTQPIKETKPIPVDQVKKKCGTFIENVAPGAIVPTFKYFVSYTSNNHEEYISSVDKPNWVYLSSPKIYPKSEYKFDNPILLWTIIAPPRKVEEGIYAFQIRIIDSNNNIKAIEKVCIDVTKNAKSVQDTEFKSGDTITIGVIDIGVKKQADYEKVFEDLIEYATSGQFKDKIEYLGKIDADIKSIIENKKFDILFDFIKKQGKDPDDYDYILTIGKEVPQGVDITADIESKVPAFDNIRGKNFVNLRPEDVKSFPAGIDTYLHEIGHPLSNRKHIPYGLVFSPPTAGYLDAIFYSNPLLHEMGLEPHERGVYLVVEESGYQEIKEGEKLVYHIHVRNTGKQTDSYVVRINNDISNKYNIFTIERNHVAGWSIANANLDELAKNSFLAIKELLAVNGKAINFDGKQTLTTQITLSPDQTVTLLLEIDASKLKSGLYGFEVTAESTSNKEKIDFSKLKIQENLKIITKNMENTFFKKENVGDISGGLFKIIK